MLLEYFQQHRDKLIEGKTLAKKFYPKLKPANGKREIRDDVKAANLFLISTGATELICSSNERRKNGYKLTSDQAIIDRYRAQQSALSKHIGENAHFAEIVLKRQAAKESRLIA